MLLLAVVAVDFDEEMPLQMYEMKLPMKVYYRYWLRLLVYLHHCQSRFCVVIDNSQQKTALTTEDVAVAPIEKQKWSLDAESNRMDVAAEHWAKAFDYAGCKANALSSHH